MTNAPPGAPGSPDEPAEALVRFTRGDTGRASALSTNLRILREASGDRDFQRLVDDVLTGRRILREAVRSPEFDRAIAPHVERFGQWWDERPDEERHALAAEGEQWLDEAREGNR